MEHCRKLDFTQDPDYEYLVGLFNSCMEENNFDPKTYDYTWKEDWLKRDKLSLKEEIMKAIGGKKKAPEETKA